MEFIVALVIVVVATFVVFRYWRRTIVFEYERAVLFRQGRFQRVLEPGMYWYNNATTTITKLDTRPRFVSISGQELLSADHISLKLSVVAQYAIADPQRAVQNSTNYQEALYLIIQLALRSITSSVTIEELLANRRLISEQLMEQTASQIEALGLNLLMVQVKDITFPGELKRLFAQILKAQKEGQAALEKARGETAALRHLANAAKMLDNNPSLLQLRALLSVSENAGSTVVVNIPPSTGVDAITAQRSPRKTSGEAE